MNVKYSGRLVSGLSFVSSSDEGKPVPGSSADTFSHSRGKDVLVKGLAEALNDMKTGEKRLLIIPPDLAYGLNSGFYGKDIPGQKRFVISPGETLILEVTLVSFR
jgi:FKBP-type peptidyl-prolyl cis-trans isomerase